MSQGCRARQGGFALIEVLIVILVIAVLAAIVIPRIWPTVREARESELRADLHGLRNAAALFMAHCSDWPAQLEDLLATDPTGLVGASGRPIPPECFQGPYFISSPDGQLPIDPFTGARDWDYDPSTGAIHSSSTLTATDGTLYNSW
ncbi:MAG: type II secretion system protein [Armatimonadetes bacterium]|nr:type II secretion system protein [Armatimonadota bacterium]